MRNLSLAAVLVAIALVAASAPNGVADAAAAKSARSAAASEVLGLRAQLRTGSLADGHGVDRICAARRLACDVEVVTAAAGSAAALRTDQPVGYGPDELARAYELKNATSDAGVVAIVDSGADPNLESDLAIYRSTYGLPSCPHSCVRQLKYQGGPPYQPATGGTQRDDEEYSGYETSLDAEMVAAGCPRCEIIELQIPLRDVYAGGNKTARHAALHTARAVQTAAGLGANVVSMSLTVVPTDYSDTGEIAQLMTRPGMALVASSGDEGLKPYGSASWPQNLSTVTSVGGTSLYPADNKRGYFEVAWNGSSSSCAYDQPHAAGQPRRIGVVCAAPGAPGSHRAAVDVAADANPYTGVAVYDSYAPSSHVPGGFVVIGGTSDAAPFVAGLYGRAPLPATLLGPNTIYAAPAGALHDITDGRNASFGDCEYYQLDPVLCAAGPGWDGPTGEGTPHGLGAFHPG
jgi:subtilase family serine protease